jgi:hypothetical protein
VSASTRVELALAFLQEAVYRSRESKPAGAGFLSGASNCGLGERPSVQLELGARGQELCSALWPEGLSPQQFEVVRECMAEWVRRQDGLDRKRNHYLKDFRQANGMDRTRYSPQQSAEFEQGLAKINQEETQLRLAAAESMLAETQIKASESKRS